MTSLPAHRATGRSVVADVTWFFAIAIALCFALSVPMVFRLVPTDLYNLITPIMQLTPLLAAIIMWLARRPGTFRETFATGWRGAPKWLGIGIGLIAAIAAIQTAIAVSSGIWPLNPVDEILAASVWIIPVFVMQSVFAIGEEFGWRGWLATRAASWGFWRLALVSGLVWVVWHLPVLGHRHLLRGHAAVGPSAARAPLALRQRLARRPDARSDQQHPRVPAAVRSGRHRSSAHRGDRLGAHARRRRVADAQGRSDGRARSLMR